MIKSRDANREGQARGDRGTCQDEKKRQLYQYQADIRAGSKIRQLILKNRLQYHWTLTYGIEAVQERSRAANDFKTFMKRLRYVFKQPIPYVAVMEIQEKRAAKTGQQVIHFHMATNRFIPQPMMELTWKHGYVFVSKQSGDLSKVAGYLSKYLKKGLAEQVREPGEKRYFTSRGLQRPSRVKLQLDAEKLDKLTEVKQWFADEEGNAKGIWFGQLPTDVLVASAWYNAQLEADKVCSDRLRSARLGRAQAVSVSSNVKLLGDSVCHST